MEQRLYAIDMHTLALRIHTRKARSIINQGLDLEWCTGCDVGLPTPDLVIFLKLDPEIASKRGGKYSNVIGDYGLERYENVEFQMKVQSAFMALSSSDAKRWAIIDASRSVDLVKLDVCAEAINVINSVAGSQISNDLWKRKRLSGIK